MKNQDENTHEGKPIPSDQVEKIMERELKPFGLESKLVQPPNGTASVRFMTRLKKDEK